MPARKSRRVRNSLEPIAEIALLAPWVIGLRLARFADTRPASRKRNLNEATRMITEKSAALAEGSWAAGAAMMRAQWRLLQGIATSPLDIAAAAAGPMRRRVKRNVRRLGPRR